jgi:hypothetical protein
MIYHIVTGDVAGAALSSAVTMEPSMAGEVVVIRDLLNLGPLQKEEGQKFSEMRSVFWQSIINNDKNVVTVDDTERLSEVSIALSKNEKDKAWIWIAPWPADICTYYWLLKYLGQYTGRVFIINIAGLPFLDEQGKIFFPKNIGEIQAKELVKARRLARPVTPAELEVDSEDWQRLTKENTGIRVHEGGKKIISKSEQQYDSQLLGFCTHQFQKASRIVAQTLTRYNTPTGDLYLGWRLRSIADTGKLELQGDTAKTLKDFDVKLPGDGTNAQYSLPLE